MSSRKVGNILWSALLVLGLWVGLESVVLAQGDASIWGTVNDTTGGAIQGVGVRIKNLETGAERNQITDEDGQWFSLMTR